jgi:hypothetical protein
MSNKYQKEFFKCVEKERERQDYLWGPQEHGDFIWTAILMSEIGDLHRALLKYEEDFGDMESVTKELVHCAAVLTAMYEDRERAIGK